MSVGTALAAVGAGPELPRASRAPPRGFNSGSLTASGKSCQRLLRLDSEKVMNSRVVRIVALVASIGLAACGESTDLVMGELSEAEAQGLASAILNTTFSSTDVVAQQQPAQSPGGPQAAPYEYFAEFEALEVECALGGVVSISGSIDVSGDDETGAFLVDYSITQVHDGCVAVSEAESVFTLQGHPSLTLSFTADNNGQGLVSWSGTLQGSVHWVTDGRQNTCELALEFGGSQEGETAISGELSGTVCGFQVAQSFSVG